MGRKYYIHGTGELREDGKLYCTICGRELPGNMLKQPFPCSISAPLPFDEDISINVCIPSRFLDKKSYACAYITVQC